MLKQHHSWSYQIFEVDDSVAVIVEVVIVRNTVVVVIVIEVIRNTVAITVLGFVNNHLLLPLHRDVINLSVVVWINIELIGSLGLETVNY